MSDFAPVGKLSDAALPIPFTYFPSTDSFLLANNPMPGKWVLESADRVFGWQEQKGQGLSGATAIPTGDPLVHIKFTGYLWKELDMLAFNFARISILTKPAIIIKGTKIVSAPSIVHPELIALGITNVVIEKLSPLTNKGGGMWTCNLELLEYRPPVDAPPTVKQAIPPGVRNVPSTALAARQVVLAANTAAIEKQLGTK